MPGPGGVQNETDVNRFALLRCVELGVCEKFSDSNNSYVRFTATKINYVLVIT
jgi:hypothetical protein